VAAGRAAAQQAREAADVLAAVLVCIPQPHAGLVPALMQQLEGRLHKLPPSALLQLAQAFDAAGMSCAPASGAASGDARAPERVVPAALGLEFRNALASALTGVSAGELARACASLQRMGLTADAATAEAVVNALQRHMAAAADADASILAPVAGYITDSGFRPTAAVMEGVEAALLGLLRSDGASAADAHVVAAATTGCASSSGADQAAATRVRQRLSAPHLATLLLALNRWGRRPASEFGAAAWAASRPLLVDCDAATLGPLLLGLCSISSHPSEPWLLDWAGVSAQRLRDASAQDVAAMAAALAQAGGAAGCVGSNWWAPFSDAVLRFVPAMAPADLEAVCASLYRLQHRPSSAWLAALLAQLEAQVPDASADTPGARALAFARQLRATDSR
jgi:hypothetical protein